MDVKRVARFVEKTKADAWVVVAGSREVLEWFAAQPQPAFALFGRRHRVDIASVGPETTPTIAAVARRLVELGHRRIVMLSRRERRLPEPAQFERAFLAELEVQWLSGGSLQPAGLGGNQARAFTGFSSRCSSLTPPTALIVHEAPQFIAVLRFLGQQGLRVPEDVSLICHRSRSEFQLVRTAHGAHHLGCRHGGPPSRALGRQRQPRQGQTGAETSIPAKFVEGGTIGPARE